MKAITLKHPWAFAVARLGKDVENRTWKPPKSLIGQRIAIHGGAIPKGNARDEYEFEVMCMTKHILVKQYWQLLNEVNPSAILWLRENKFFGRDCTDGFSITPGIVATANIGHIFSPSEELVCLSPWYAGPYAWSLVDVQPLDAPIPCRGAQGLWDVPESIDRLIEAGSLA